MFTKYNNVNIPSNYSGSRFKAPIEEMGMKTHRAQTPPSGVKTSVSPAFQGVLDNGSLYTQPLEAEAEENIIEKDFDIEEEEITDTPSAETENTSPKAQQSEMSRLLDASGLTRVLESIGKDDILLLALILLMAGDGEQSNMDAIIILALLLMYHQDKTEP